MEGSDFLKSGLSVHTLELRQQTGESHFWVLLPRYDDLCMFSLSKVGNVYFYPSGPLAVTWVQISITDVGASEK